MSIDASAAPLELGLQELEELEAPGWIDVVGFSLGAVASSAVTYIGSALAVSAIT
ncbi:daptide-type RiPP [uncultured Cellulomonas sp.]|uniref:daptide-type RiPP n=1 Tax=uncultured Cellulomonas sp. TaxID=189682 RepID=UPI002626E580|nr:daptide-type RiPP [uncultured Cellulomonas sp.]